MWEDDGGGEGDKISKDIMICVNISMWVEMVVVGRWQGR